MRNYQERIKCFWFKKWELCCGQNNLSVNDPKGVHFYSVRNLLYLYVCWKCKCMLIFLWKLRKILHWTFFLHPPFLLFLNLPKVKAVSMSGNDRWITVQEAYWRENQEETTCLPKSLSTCRASYVYWSWLLVWIGLYPYSQNTRGGG